MNILKKNQTRPLLKNFSSIIKYILKIFMISVISFFVVELLLRFIFTPGLQIHKVFQDDDYRLTKMLMHLFQ